MIFRRRWADSFSGCNVASNTFQENSVKNSLSKLSIFLTMIKYNTAPNEAYKATLTMACSGTTPGVTCWSVVSGPIFVLLPRQIQYYSHLHSFDCFSYLISACDPRSVEHRYKKFRSKNYDKCICDEE